MTLGLDISTACIGYSVFSDDNKLLELNCVKFKSKQTMFEKLQSFKKATEHFKDFPIKRVSIEEPLKKFAGKFSSAHTIAVLNFFNGMISSYVFDLYELEPEYYNVNAARKTVFPDLKLDRKGKVAKYQIWKGVMELEPQINWRYGVRSRKLSEENFDMSDSYVVSMCAIILAQKQRDKLNS